MNCININSPEFKALSKATGIPNYDLDYMIAKWQENNDTFDFPTADELLRIDNGDASDSDKIQDKFNTKLKEGLIGFIKGLNIEVVENADDILDNLNLNYGKPTAAFDTLQKYLALKSNITNKDLALQSASIIYTFMGKKSKLSLEIWKNIDKWSKYQEVYDKYANVHEVVSEDIEFYNEKFNPFAHRQAIIHMIAEALQIGIDNKFIGEKRNNPDVDKTFFENLGFKNKYEQDFAKNIFNRIWNWVNEKIFGSAINTNMKEEELKDLILDIVDDVYKGEYSKFIRSYKEVEPGVFKNLKGEDLEQKFYQKTLDQDPFANEVIQSLFNNPFVDYKLSGSQVIRKYGRLIRAVSEDLHDIDGVITLNQFNSEANAPKFLRWLETRGLELMRKRKQKQFTKEIIPFLEQQSWYQNIKNMYPTWTLESTFIGKDHKNAESVTISGYIEHPTEMETLEDGTIQPKRYILDFFLRTKEGRYPEIFDNYWKDWKQIFEAKVNMGRAKDLNDLIYFQPFVKDKYKFTNKGFRYFTFPDNMSAAEVAEYEVNNKEFAIFGNQLNDTIILDDDSVQEALNNCFR
jgi:hypothetical protein